MVDVPIAVELSVVVPVYRSADTLAELVRRLLVILEATGRTFEIILVEDGGEDKSWKVLEGLRSSHPREIVAVQLMRNFGQHNALMCGLRLSRGEIVITLDDDLQNPPEEIPKLLHALVAGDLDLVYGVPAGKRQAGWRNAGSALVNAFYRRVFQAGVVITSFRAIRRQLLELVFSYTLNFTFLDGLFAWNTRRIGQVGVEHQPRRVGRSGYTFRKLLELAVNLFTNFSIAPLELSFYTGLAAAAGGFMLSAYYLIQYFLANIVVPGYASIIIAILVMGGAQLLALGLIGQYLGRLHLNVNCKPQYAVRQVLGRVPADAKSGRARLPSAGNGSLASPAHERPA